MVKLIELFNVEIHGEKASLKEPGQIMIRCGIWYLLKKSKESIIIPIVMMEYSSLASTNSLNNSGL